MPAVPTDLVWERVASTNITAIALEVTPTAPYRRLWVRFKSGATYFYDSVPSGLFEAFLAAPSKGRFLFEVVRAKGTDSIYAYGRL